MADAQPTNPLWNAVSAYAVNQIIESESGLIRALAGRIILVIPKTAVEGLRSSFQPNNTYYWPGLPANNFLKGAPALWRSEMEVDMPGKAGFSRITLLYRKPKLIAQQTKHMDAILYAKFYGEPRKIKAWRFPNGEWKAIEGPDITEKQTEELRLSEWRVERGSNIKHDSFGAIRLRVAYDLIPFDQCVPNIGKLNSGVVTFGGAFGEGNLAAKTLRYDGMAVQTELNDDGLAIVNHEFSFKADGWADTCRSRRFVKRVLSVKLKELNGGVFRDHRVGGNATGRTTQMIIWEKTDSLQRFDLYEKTSAIDFNTTILDNPHEASSTTMGYLNVNIIGLDKYILSES